MKVLVAILALVACVCAEKWVPKSRAQLKEIRQECLKQHRLSAEQLSKAKYFEFADEEAPRQFLLCMVKEMGVFSSQQGYDVARFAKQFSVAMPKTEIQKLAKACIAEYPKGDKADDVSAFEVQSCLIKTPFAGKLRSYFNRRYKKAKKRASFGQEIIMKNKI